MPVIKFVVDALAGFLVLCAGCGAAWCIVKIFSAAFGG
jgi:hypothetical protein